MAKKSTKSIETNYALECSIDTKLLLNIMKCVKATNTECHIQITEQAILIQEIDPSRIMLISVFLSADDCENYLCRREQTFGFNIEDLVKVLDRVKNVEKITMKIDDINHYVEIIADKKKFKNKLIELTNNDIKTEALERRVHDFHVQLSIEVVEDCVKDAILYSETIRITCDQNELLFSAEGMVGCMDAVFEHEDEMFQNWDFVKIASGEFSNTYMKYILTSKSLAERCDLYLYDDEPLMWRITFGGCSSATWWLAARIEQDDDDDYDSKMEAETENVEEDITEEDFH